MLWSVNEMAKQDEKRKSEKKRQIHNLIILDESGSMGMIKQATIDGFQNLKNNILSSELEFKKQEHLVSVVTFNGKDVKFRLFAQPVSELVSFNSKNYHPDSTTPLYDAICKSVFKLKHELHSVKNYRVLVTVITDGCENSSKEFTRKETKFLIESMSEDSRWGFGLIGANIDIGSTARSLAIPLERTIEFESNDESVSDLFSRYGAAQYNMSAAFDVGCDFSDDIAF
jgi:Mg-chelatase subunit ChlD